MDPAHALLAQRCPRGTYRSRRWVDRSRRIPHRSHGRRLRGADPTAVYPAAETIAQTVIAPLAILALASGLIQGLVTRWGVLRHWWVAIKLSLTVALVVVVFTLLLPRLGEAANLPAQQGGSLTTQLPAQLVVFPTVAVTVLLVLVALAIYKPFGRLSARKSGGVS